MIRTLNIRKRLLVLGSIWLFLYTCFLAVYLIKEARDAQLLAASKRSQTLANNLAEKARIAFYSGDESSINHLLRNLQSHPDVLSARIEKNITSVQLRAGKTKEPTFVTLQGLRGLQAQALISTEPAGGFASDINIFGPMEAMGQTGLAIVALSVEPIYAQVELLATKAILILAIFLFVFLVIGWTITGTIISPLRRLAVHVSTLAEPSVNGLPYEGRSKDEIEMIEHTMTQMKNSIDRKSREIHELQVSFEEKLRQQTAILEQKNSDLAGILHKKNEMISRLTHELKNPLGALTIHLNNLQANIDRQLTDTQRDRFSRSIDLLERLRRMLTEENVVASAVAETDKLQLKRQKIDLLALGKQALFALEPMQHQMNVQCRLSDNIQGKRIFADPDHIEQILQNLIHNAIKASRPGSIVVIDAEERENELEVRVKDSGVGIPRRLQVRLFKEPVEPNGKMTGSGVGLTICHFLVELHGGRIWFETDPKSGTTFNFTLPKEKFLTEAKITND